MNAPMQHAMPAFLVPAAWLSTTVDAARAKESRRTRSAIIATEVLRMPRNRRRLVRRLARSRLRVPTKTLPSNCSQPRAFTSIPATSTISHPMAICCNLSACIFTQAQARFLRIQDGIRAVYPPSLLRGSNLRFKTRISNLAQASRRVRRFRRFDPQIRPFMVRQLRRR